MKQPAFARMTELEMDYTSELHTRLMAEHEQMPSYPSNERTGGPAHNPEFTCTAKVVYKGKEYTGVGTGGSKQASKQAASKDLLKKLPVKRKTA